MREASSKLSFSLAEAIVSCLLDEASMTRPQLVSHLRVRPATLFGSVLKLKEAGLLDEPERKGVRTGRKASPIRLRAEYLSFLGIELNVDRVVCVCLDAAGGRRGEAVVPLTGQLGAATAQSSVEKAIKESLRMSAANGLQLGGIGFADPGVVDVERGVAIKAANVPGWENVDIGKWLSGKYHVPCHAWPAPTVRAYAEYLAAGRPPSLFHLELGPAVGGGFIKNGELFIGDSFAAMEIGHIVVENDGPLCRCGNRGCLEAVAGIAGIRRRVGELISRNVQTALTSAEVDYEEFNECVRNLDKPAFSLAQDIAEKVGIGLASLVAILNPRMIVVSGGLSGLGDILLAAVRSILARRCFSLSTTKLELKISTLGDTGTATGAALLARRLALADAARRLADGEKDGEKDERDSKDGRDEN